MRLVLELTDSGRTDLAKEVGPMIFDETMGAKDAVKKALIAKTFVVNEVQMSPTTVTLKLRVKS